MKNSFKALISEINSSVEKPSKGFKTTHEYAKEWGLSREQASFYIRKGINAGLIKKKKFRTQLNNNVALIYHYKLLSKNASYKK